MKTINLILRYIDKNYFLTSFISFFFISGLIFSINTKFNLFEIMNSATLKNVSSAFPQERKNYSDNSSATLLISNTYFEKEFNSITPLNKDKLKLLLERIIVHNPKTIVLDLDISPDFNFTKNTSLKSDIYKYLEEVSSHVHIVLPFTFIANTKENMKTKLQWAKRMCNSNIDFAFPFLESEIGTVLQYRTYKSHVSYIANNDTTKKVCNQIATQEDINSLVEKEYNLFQKSFQIPINFKQISSNSIILNSIEDIDKYNLQDKTLFIGGSYGFSDKYVTPFGEKNGVEILNAVFYSIHYTIDAENIFVATLIDILVGISFGYVVSYLLRKRLNVKTNDEKIKNNTALVTVLIIFMFISYILSAVVFHKFYVWINPFPIVLGIFIDLLIGMDNKKFEIDISTSWLTVLLRYSFCLMGMYSYYV